MDALHAELNERTEAAARSYSAQSIFTIHLFVSCGQESVEDPMKVFSLRIFLHRYFVAASVLYGCGYLLLL